MLVAVDVDTAFRTGADWGVVSADARAARLRLIAAIAAFVAA
jgi:hypothetical protein